jgi:hypothetical protein
MNNLCDLYIQRWCTSHKTISSLVLDMMCLFDNSMVNASTVTETFMRHQGNEHVASNKYQIGLRSLTALAALAMAVTIAENAHSAEFREIPSNDASEVIITIEGEIKSGDDEKFRAIAAKHSNAVVFLNSEGGAIVPAMDIGRTVKLRGYKTVVSDSDSCASACALIWVSGSRRVLFEGGQVGFHASYLDTDGTRLETGLGNALVGRYLTQLGYGEKTVIFATLAPPTKSSGSMTKRYQCRA